ncbi:Integrase [Theobroma cacao]|nr:Integrase [Theobroma cacao]
MVECPLPVCESCIEAKMTKGPFKAKGNRMPNVLDLVHTDVCGAMNVEARGGYEYFITFIDDSSRHGFVYLMHRKSESFEKFKEFKAEVEKQLGKPLKQLRSDRGGEYLSDGFQQYLINNGIISNLSAPRTPQHNGVAKRRNKTLLEMVRSMMSYANLPISLWGYCMQTAQYLLNFAPSKAVPKTPRELWIGRYPKGTRGYYFYSPQDKNVFFSMNAIFLEEEFVRNHKPRSEIVLEELSDPLDLRVNSEDVITQSDSRVMKSELDSMDYNKVWTLVDPSEGIKPIGWKWIYKRKTRSDGKVETFKARLVAKGFTQREGIDYEDTFSPVAMVKSIRILLSIATHLDYEIWQMDVKIAFLNGDLEERIYMTQSEGFIKKGHEHKVCELHRSIYGLKQASRSWNIRFDTAIKSYDFQQNVDKPCVYKRIQDKKVIFLVLYVDGILLIGNDIGMLSTVKGWLNHQFNMKDLGEASYVLGIKLIRDRKNKQIALSQASYIDKILAKFAM